MMRRIEELERRIALAANATLIADVGDVKVIDFQDTTYFAESVDGTANVYRTQDGQSELFDQLIGIGDGVGLSATDNSIYLVSWSNGRIWSSDGIAGFTQVDIPATQHASPRGFVTYEDHTFFATDIGVYRTDGTPNGIQLIYEESNVRKLAVAGNVLLTFEAENFVLPGPGLGFGTGKIVRVNLETGERFEVIDSVDSSYFTGNSDAVHFRFRSNLGVEIWRVDGSTGDTQQVAMLPSVDTGSRLPFLDHSASLSVVDGIPYFSVDDGVHGVEVWTSGDTSDAPLRLTTSNAGHVRQFTLSEFQGQLQIAISETTGHTAWTTDGTIEGTLPVDVPDGTVSYQPLEDRSVAFVESGEQREIWQKPAGEANYSRTLTLDVDGRFSSSVSANGYIYFVIDDGSGSVLWRTNGTTEGTERIERINRYLDAPPQLGMAGDYVFYNGYESPQKSSSPALRAIRETTPTTVTQGLFVDLIDSVAGLGDQLFYSNSDPRYGIEPWSWDGETEQLLADTNSQTVDVAIFEAASNASSFAIFAYRDGEVEEFLLEIQSVGNEISAVGFDFWNESSAVNSQFYHWIGDEIFGEEIVRLDEGNFATIVTSELGSIESMVASGDSLFFVTSVDRQWTFWQYTPLTKNTQIIATVPSRSDFRSPEIVQLNDSVLFLAGSEAGATQLWTSDGSEASLVEAVTGVPSKLQRVGETVFFQLTSNETNELWKSDGTADGTKLVYSPAAGESLNVTEPFEANGQLFFINDGRLWVSDGTAAGTASAVTQELTSARNLIVHNDEIHFTAANEQKLRGLYSLSLVDQNRLAGDANRDGEVDFNDFLILSQNFGKRVDSVWEDGDFNADAKVSFEDFVILSQNFGRSKTT